MAPATARIILAAWFFFLTLSVLSHHVCATFSFDFSNTSSYSLEDLLFEGSAALNGDVVDLTCNPKEETCSERLSYKHPVILYDNTTGELASFSTSFTFSTHVWPDNFWNAISFFLSGYSSRLPRGVSNEIFGLARNLGNTTGADRFLAVVFDNYNHLNDTSGDHMGIDLNNVDSVTTTRLPGYSLNGTMSATITFDNATRTLEATLHFGADRSLADARVKTQLPDDLHALLPPIV